MKTSSELDKEKDNERWKRENAQWETDSGFWSDTARDKVLLGLQTRQALPQEPLSTERLKGRPGRH